MQANHYQHELGVLAEALPHQIFNPGENSALRLETCINHKSSPAYVTSPLTLVPLEVRVQ